LANFYIEGNIMTDTNWYTLAAESSFTIRNLIEGELSSPGGDMEISKHSEMMSGVGPA
jgi:hypothetical protein